jgi:hypothetical protein
MFEVVKACHEQLLQDYTARQADKPHHDLKTAFNHAKPAPSVPAKPRASPQQKFDADKFNQFFEDNRISDAYQQQGYGDWMRKNDPDALGKNVSGGAIIHYKEPEPLLTGVANEPFFELGVERIRDFSGIHGVDYRVAYTKTHLVDERAVQNRPTYASVDELERDRARMSTVPDPAMLAASALKKKAEAEREAKRVAALNRHDNMWAQHFEKVNRLMLAAGQGTK